METGEVSSDDVRVQTRVALDKIKAALEEAGSSLENIVKVVVYFKDMKDYERVRDRVRILQGTCPCSGS